MPDDAYVREITQRFLEALGELWSATDYREATEFERYSDDELKVILGEWIHVRTACERLFENIRRARPDLPGWDPIGKEKPVDVRLRDAEGPA